MRERGAFAVRALADGTGIARFRATREEGNAMVFVQRSAATRSSGEAPALQTNDQAAKASAAQPARPPERTGWAAATRRIRSALCVAAIAASAVAAPLGCEAEAVPPDIGGYSTAYVDTVPPNIYAYPHVWFSGGYAYMVGDNWYYPNRGRWVRLRREPPELSRYRAQYGYARPAPASPATRTVPSFPANRGPVTPLPAPIQRNR
jgi:hypothetical protein